jgi:hypothetical protein
MKSGPDWMPWMVSAPSITAVTASPGMPKAMMVTSDPATFALFQETTFRGEPRAKASTLSMS